MVLGGTLGEDADAIDLPRVLLAELPAAVAILGRDGRVVERNAEWSRLFGDAATVGELGLRALGGGEESPLARALTGESVHGQEYENARADGGLAWLRVSAVPLEDARGGRVGALAMCVDVSERRALEEVRQQVLGVVAHDLRNPLSAMRMTTSMLARPKDMPLERRVQLAERMLGTLGRMEAIVSSLLDFTRADAGVGVRLLRERVDLGEVCERARRDLEVLFPGDRIRLDVAGDAVGLWDRAQVERIVSNLLTNALKHGAEGGTALVTLDGSQEDVVTLSVHNEGPPIAPELMAEVYEPFTIGPVGEDGRRRNIGLGLFVVQHLVAAHGGSVQGESSAEAGTTFTVSLPRARP
jgi:signal transduction histidine kinase